MSVPPGLAAFTGQFCVTTSRAVVCNGHVADALPVTTAAVHMSLPRAVTVLLTVQLPAGVRKLALKLAEAPGASVATVNTVGGEDCASVTVTLVSVMLPEFLTVPV